MNTKAFYPHDPVRSVQSLAFALRTTETHLKGMVQRISQLYIGPTPKPKKNGDGVRLVYDTKPPLKSLLRKVNSVFFEAVRYPPYLTGSLPGTDYVQNVSIHRNARIVISEDVATFFDRITSEHVFDVWTQLFRFSEPVSELLTALTTKDGRVYQGTPTSSYLANLAFWNIEGALFVKLSQRGIRYSRYVDDITLSSTDHLSRSDISWAIGQVYGMIISRGFAPKRNKHQIQTAAESIKIMGLVANKKPSLPPTERAKIRSEVFQFEQRFKSGLIDKSAQSSLNSLAGRIARMQMLHPREGMKLRGRFLNLARKLDSVLETNEFRREMA